MSENKPIAGKAGRARQRGVSSIEFALLAVIFFALVFGIIETARALYLFATLQEVTRRAAAEAAISAFDSTTQTGIRERALIGNIRGKLILGDPVSVDHLKIEYLALSRDPDTNALEMIPAAPMPADPATNYLNCLTNPYAANCIRVIRTSICVPGGAADCSAVPYQMLLPITDFSGLTLPRATTVVPAQTMGRDFGAVPSP